MMDHEWCRGERKSKTFWHNPMSLFLRETGFENWNRGEKCVFLGVQNVYAKVISSRQRKSLEWKYMSGELLKNNVGKNNMGEVPKWRWYHPMCVSGGSKATRKGHIFQRKKRLHWRGMFGEWQNHVDTINMAEIQKVNDDDRMFRRKRIINARIYDGIEVKRLWQP